MRGLQQWRIVLTILIACSTLLPFQSLNKTERYLQSFSTKNASCVGKASFHQPPPSLDHEQQHSSKRIQNTFNNVPYKPLFVIHIGPVKTGTTTLQCALQSLSHDLLSLDQFIVAETESCRPDIPPLHSNLTWTKGGEATYDNVVLGKAFMPNCLGQWNSQNNETVMPACWTDSYERVARQHAQHNNSIIVSNEILSQTMSRLPVDFVNDLVESLKDFCIKIVVTYRPWLEWVASLQDQTTKGFLEKHRDWPGQGNTRARKLESLQHYIGRQLSNRRRQQPASFPFVDDAIRIFQNDSRVQLEILDIHQDGDLVTNFVCKVLSGATNTCNKLKFDRDGGRVGNKKNKAENRQWYDMLAVHAHEQGLVSGQSRLHVYRQIRDYQETVLNKTSTDFAKSCPPKTFLTRIWRESLRREKKIRPKQQHRRMQRRLRAVFDKAVQSKKFCTINATAVLEDPKWIDFFETLNR